MSNEVTTPKETLFEKFYNIKDEALASMQKPIVRRALKRKITSGVDNLTEQIQEQEALIHNQYTKIKDMDVSAVSAARIKLKRLIEQRADLRELYVEMFGKAYAEDEE